MCSVNTLPISFFVCFVLREGLTKVSQDDLEFMNRQRSWDYRPVLPSMVKKILLSLDPFALTAHSGALKKQTLFLGNLPFVL